jgi:tRNA pseudouridine55 synthase
MMLTSIIVPKVLAFEMLTPAKFGLLNIDKPRGKTSRWVVDQVKRLVRPEKVGHAGTLDPLATGVLVVAVGAATRLVEYVQQLPKRYRAEFLLGRTSDTEDTQGQVTELVDPRIPDLGEVQAAAAGFVGEIQQRPPAFSALKVAGKRAYALARKGHDVELEPRAVTVHGLTVNGYEYPRLTLDVECSSGTYIRSLGRDLAESLRTGAVMSALERTAIGSFRVEDAIGVSALSRDRLQTHLLPARLAVAHLPAITLGQADARRIATGQFVNSDHLRSASNPHAVRADDAGEFAAFDESGNLVAILARRKDGLLGPALNFATSSR